MHTTGCFVGWSSKASASTGDFFGWNNKTKQNNGNKTETNPQVTRKGEKLPCGRIPERSPVHCTKRRAYGSWLSQRCTAESRNWAHTLQAHRPQHRSDASPQHRGTVKFTRALSLCSCPAPVILALASWHPGHTQRSEKPNLAC